jgi:hypothetical protein
MTTPMRVLAESAEVGMFGFALAWVELGLASLRCQNTVKKN